MKKISRYFKQEVMLPIAPASDIESLKSFGLLFSIAVPVVFTGILPLIFDAPRPHWPMLVSFVLILLYLFKPKWLYPLYLCWMYVASILGWINTKVILLLAYLMLIVPIGLFLRLCGKLQYQAAPKGDSTYHKIEKGHSKSNLKEPF